MMGSVFDLQRWLYGGALDALNALHTVGFAGLPTLIAAAFGFGLLHALLPGHGKSVLASYYAGDGRLAGAIGSSVILILTHVGSAVVLVLGGFVILQRTIGGAGRAPALEHASQVLIVLIGLWLLWRALRSSSHGHDRSAAALAVVTGLVPCPLTTFIMTYAVANGLLVSGLVLSGTFAAGMIVTVAAFPLLAVLLRTRRAAENRGPWGWRAHDFSIAGTTAGKALGNSPSRYPHTCPTLANARGLQPIGPPHHRVRTYRGADWAIGSGNHDHKELNSVGVDVAEFRRYSGGCRRPKSSETSWSRYSAEVAEISLELIAMLAAVAALAGFVDAIAGGGGLLTIPAMLLVGMDPVAAIATNKLQGTFGVASASVTFARRGIVDWRAARAMMAAAFAGSVIGAILIASVPVPHLEAGLPILLVALAIYFVLSPRMSDVDAQPRMPQPAFAASVIPAVGVYDGAFGPAAGSFYTLGFLTLRGNGLLRATAHAKLMNFASNAGALALFIIAGKPVWLVGLPMAAASILGAQLGSRLAVANGARIIKPVLVLACVAMAVKLLLDPAQPLWEMLR